MQKVIIQSQSYKRTPTGQGIMAMIGILAVFAILPLSLLAFEIARYCLMQQQLHNITDSAALSGTGALATVSTTSGLAAGQTAAMNAALSIFEQNSILDTTLTSSNVSASLNTTALSAPTTARKAVVNITLLDKNGSATSTGSASDPAVTMQIKAWYADSPVFVSNVLPIQTLETALATSNGGLPQLDIILCFDVSGSMDDLTPVVLIKRYWNGSTATQSTTAGTSGSGSTSTIYSIFGPPYTGTGFNIMWPENLSFGSYVGAGLNTNQYVFTEGSYSSDLNGLRANLADTPPGAIVPEQGCPPGNYTAADPGWVTINGNTPTAAAYSKYFTDEIPATLVGASVTTSQGTYTFVGGLGLPLEAAHGNLESAALRAASKSNNTPKAGYYNAYWTWVQANAQPIATARTAAVNFYTTMNNSANAHFGLVTFASTAASSASGNSSGTNVCIDSNYTGGGTGSFPLPLIALSSSSSNYDPTNATGVTGALLGTATSLPAANGKTLPLGPLGTTDIADALNTAISELTGSNSRAQAKKAIILFTDGVPNIGTSGSGPDYGAFASATTANSDNIPIYTIGLSTNATITPYETEVLGDGNNSDGTGAYGNHGIAYLSGNLATYQQVSSAASLDQAFQNIARALVVLQ